MIGAALRSDKEVVIACTVLRSKLLREVRPGIISRWIWTWLVFAFLFPRLALQTANTLDAALDFDTAFLTFIAAEHESSRTPKAPRTDVRACRICTKLLSCHFGFAAVCAHTNTTRDASCKRHSDLVLEIVVHQSRTEICLALSPVRWVSLRLCLSLSLSLSLSLCVCLCLFACLCVCVCLFQFLLAFHCCTAVATVLSCHFCPPR